VNEMHSSRNAGRYIENGRTAGVAAVERKRNVTVEKQRSKIVERKCRTNRNGRIYGEQNGNETASNVRNGRCSGGAEFQANTHPERQKRQEQEERKTQAETVADRNGGRTAETVVQNGGENKQNSRER